MVRLGPLRWCGASLTWRYDMPPGKMQGVPVLASSMMKGDTFVMPSGLDVVFESTQ